MTRRFLYLVGIASTLPLIAAACGASNDDGGTFDEGDESSTTVSSANVGGSTADSGVGGFDPSTVSGAGGSTGSGSNCSTPGDVDDDGDGFTENQGDCNDCDANVNPGAVEVVITDPDENGVVPEPADEDCDGTVDNPIPSCDSGLAVGDTDPYHAAGAIGLCQQATANDSKWGVLDAKWVRANGSGTANTSSYGIIDNFGPNVNPQEGASMVIVSSGYGRRPSDSGACGSQSCTTSGAGTPPVGFPQGVPNCLGGSNINDDVGLDLQLRTPKNATGYKFSFKFHSFEFPEWVCTTYNDQFIALVTPSPAGSINGNISFDSAGNPVSVNVAFFDVCDPSGGGQWAALCFSGCPPQPNPYCPSGAAELAGTGFDTWASAGDAGGTSWLQTQAPVTGGDVINIRFAIWDTGDTALDSTAVIDGFEWLANGGTVVVGTDPVDDPK